MYMQWLAASCVIETSLNPCSKLENDLWWNTALASGTNFIKALSEPCFIHSKFNWVLDSVNINDWIVMPKCASWKFWYKPRGPYKISHDYKVQRWKSKLSCVNVIGVRRCMGDKIYTVLQILTVILCNVITDCVPLQTKLGERNTRVYPNSALF